MLLRPPIWRWLGIVRDALLPYEYQCMEGIREQRLAHLWTMSPSIKKGYWGSFDARTWSLSQSESDRTGHSTRLWSHRS